MIFCKQRAENKCKQIDIQKACFYFNDHLQWPDNSFWVLEEFPQIESSGLISYLEDQCKYTCTPKNYKRLSDMDGF